MVQEMSAYKMQGQRAAAAAAAAGDDDDDEDEDDDEEDEDDFWGERSGCVLSPFLLSYPLILWRKTIKKT